MKKHLVFLSIFTLSTSSALFGYTHSGYYQYQGSSYQNQPYYQNQGYDNSGYYDNSGSYYNGYSDNSYYNYNGYDNGSYYPQQSSCPSGRCYQQQPQNSYNQGYNQGNPQNPQRQYSSNDNRAYNENTRTSNSTEDAVRTKLQNDTSLSRNARNVEVSEQDGKVSLYGTVASEAEKTKVESIVKQVNGVKSVSNNLTVSKG